ncbi:MAG: hypothetical protein AAFX00_10940 [Pseudomonadota bacterium]
MGRIKSASVLILFAALPALALPVSPSERALLFADCTGRLSALEAHQWMTNGIESERTGRQRNAFADLLDAVLPDAVAHGMPAHMALSRRIHAKAAHAALLNASKFAGDPDRRTTAAKAAETYRLACLDLIPGA